MKFGLVGLVVSVVLGCVGCSALANPNVPVDAVLTAEMALCIGEHYQEPILQLMVDCKIPDQLLKDVADLQASTASAQAAAAKAGAHKKK